MQTYVLNAVHAAIENWTISALTAERGWCKMAEYKSFYKSVGGNEGDKCHYSTRLDTYGCGCQFDCDYCYAKSLLNFRGLWRPSDPAVADIEKIKRRVKKLKPGSVVRMGGMTDCFAPVEKQNRVTYETIKAFGEEDRTPVAYNR